jgi:hypothetical protein
MRLISLKMKIVKFQRGYENLIQTIDYFLLELLYKTICMNFGPFSTFYFLMYLPVVMILMNGLIWEAKTQLKRLKLQGKTQVCK